MKKILSRFLIVNFVVLLIFSSCVTTNKTDQVSELKLVILHTNDTHGHPLKFDNYPAKGVGGIPARATLIQEIRKDNPNVLLLDAGDINTGLPESNFFKAEPDIIGYNYMGYDAMVLGNHEFDKPTDVLKKQIQDAKFNFISANIKTSDGRYLVKPYIIKDFNGFKVAVFGLTTKNTKEIGNPENIKNLKFEDEIQTAKDLVPRLRLEADMVIALTHMGIYESEDEGSKKLAKNVPGIDLIVDGHSHSKIEAPIYVNKVPIIQDWMWGLTLGKGVFTIKNKKIVDFAWEAIPINLKEEIKKKDGTKEYKIIGKEIKEDEAILAQLKPYLDKVESILSEAIGTTSRAFSNSDSKTRETELGDFVADSMLWYTKKLGVDFALHNGGGMRTGLPKGQLTKKNIYEMIPFDNSVVVLSLKGTDIIALFNYIVTIKQGFGAFPQVSDGITFSINYNYKKCDDVLINGKPIDINKIYKIATSSYLSSGGDGYAVLKNAIDKYDTSVFQRDVVIEYIKSLGGNIKPILKNRINIIGYNLAGIIRYYFNKKAA